MPTAKKNVKRNKAKYEQIIDINDNKINVLILGVSGSGKSTLINSVLGTEEALTGIGEAVTKEIKIYQNDNLPFRLIDTVGYEYGLFRQFTIKKELSKFCKEGVKTKDIEKLIHMIWFCIDGTAKKIDQEVLGYIKSVTNDWKDVPIVVVLTKSYSSIEIEENILMVEKAILKYNQKHPNRQLNLKDVIPVVAKAYPIDNNTVVPSRGVDTLINRTNELIPEAKQISKEGIKAVDLKLKSTMANSIVGASTLAATTIGAVPIPIPDAAILTPLQSGMLLGISRIYGINEKDGANEIINTILKVGGTTMVGKALLNTLKGIPGLNVAAALLNAAVAGTVTFAVGETSVVLFEKVYKGELNLTGVNWEKEVKKLFDEYIPNITEAISDFSNQHDNKIDIKQLGEFIASIVNTFNKKQ